MCSICGSAIFTDVIGPSVHQCLSDVNCLIGNVSIDLSVDVLFSRLRKQVDIYVIILWLCHMTKPIGQLHGYR
jgi:hypothetical protein